MGECMRQVGSGESSLLRNSQRWVVFKSWTLGLTGSQVRSGSLGWGGVVGVG